jgi:hypothetical protein
MLRLRRSLRTFGLLWGVLQFALAGAVSVLDGAIALRGSADVAAHVEATSSSNCQPPHAADCGICRYLSSGGVNDGDVGTTEWPTWAAATVPLRAATLHASGDATRAQARAPPAA